MHAEGARGRGCNIGPSPGKFSRRLFKKDAIKPKIGDPPIAI